MGVLGKVNNLRRTLMRTLTRNIGKSNAEQGIILVNKNEIKRILICRPNARLGNLLLITPFVQELEEMFPNCKIDLFVKGFLAPVIFENYDSVDRIIELPKKPFNNLFKYFAVWVSLKKYKYDIAINVDQGSSSGRLGVKFSNSKFRFFGDLPFSVNLYYGDYAHIAKYPIYHFRDYVTRLGLEKRENHIPSLELKLTPSEIMEGRKTVRGLVNNYKKTICLFTYATGAKCLSESWWQDFYTNLTSRYENYNIIEVLPIENVSQIGFKAPTFYSKDIREIGAVIANADLFIGADSGIMHLASAVQTPTVGLFSVSNLKKYEPYDNNSIGINVNNFSERDYFKIFNTILDNGKSGMYPKAI
ncbi:ADP-heptose--LPS heptosyltransferase [Flavobacterium cheongpyeongense]|uniref:ADP-heptose--LPS heptosyltransferase n=1 Tax=Flavobacterium cheongpyeongense TaxID=2212651 RepID=A0A2V4BKG1_9FLAO|nr:glycosyltransferase family 9 protein [Flavobacterium cheongpyeongense]PXY39488.1 ADP-heptose--LPS heptosyltransferase [Flavobacterium cheongpyeongense]